MKKGKSKFHVKEKVILAKNKLPVKKKQPLEYGPIEIRMLSEEDATLEDATSEHELIDELNGSEKENDYRLESNRTYFTSSV